jgi:hypothetical protein
MGRAHIIVCRRGQINTWIMRITDAGCATHRPTRDNPTNRRIVCRWPRSMFSTKYVPRRRGRTTHRHCPSTPAQSHPSPSLNVRPSSPSHLPAITASGAAGGKPGAEHDLSPWRLRNARRTPWCRSLCSKSRKLNSITRRAAAIHAQSKCSRWSPGVS